jgi:hypothetical protein
MSFRFRVRRRLSWRTCTWLDDVCRVGSSEKSRNGRARLQMTPSSKSTGVAGSRGGASCKLERLSNQAKDVEVSEEFSSDEDQRKNRERDLRVLTPDAFS